MEDDSGLSGVGGKNLPLVNGKPVNIVDYLPQLLEGFEETYKQLINALQNFKENASEQIPHLRTMAEDLSTYLRR